MSDKKELCLWDKLRLKGFGFRTFPVPLSLVDRIKNLFGANIEPRTKIYHDHLINEINGKRVEVFGIDIWYVRATVDGEVVFDARRFDDQELFDAIELNTK